jgi:hypothetical protein
MPNCAAHHVRRPLRIAGSWLGIGVLAALVWSAVPIQDFGTRVELIENYQFRHRVSQAAPGSVPWWTVSRGKATLRSLDGELDPGVSYGLLALEPGSAIEQPLALPPGSVDSLQFDCMAVNVWFVVRDDTGRELRKRIRHFAESHAPGAEIAVPLFETRFSLSDLDGWESGGLTPRLTIRLEAADGAHRSEVAHCSAQADLPWTQEAGLRTELITELDWVFSNWLDLGLDRVGPRETAFLSTAFDAQTGKPLVYLDGGAHPFYALLGRALQVEKNERWSAAYDAYLTDLFALAYHPDTGLPRVWNVQTDQPDDETPREVAYSFGHLLDIAEKGPEQWRAQALAQAVRIGEMVLAKGVLPDGEVAARYRPRDGAPNTSYPPLRRLDVPCELARLGALTGDDRYTAAARDAFAQFEFTHSWPGTWDAIDPGFDDNYGHYGARAVKAWKAHPDEPAFRNIAEGGARHYMPIWRDALQLGGNIAADQVRCWKILRDVAALEPDLKDEVAELLRLAARNHFKGQQYADGTWGDVTIYNFDPKAYLEVGDLPGIARNLVEGLAFVYEDDLGLATPDQRALFTAVFRSSRDHYKREFGYLSTRTERAGVNPAGGGVRLGAGMVEMLHQLGDDAR